MPLAVQTVICPNTILVIAHQGAKGNKDLEKREENLIHLKIRSLDAKARHDLDVLQGLMSRNTELNGTVVTPPFLGQRGFWCPMLPCSFHQLVHQLTCLHFSADLIKYLNYGFSRTRRLAKPSNLSKPAPWGLAWF
jgi:hypothetical protein